MKPAFILGIDGLPYTLARRLIDEGVMPNLGVLAKRGTLAQMHTTVPDFSCVAWTSFATGVNPGKHGIYGFQDFSPQNGNIYVPTISDCRAPALWHEVGNAGGRAIVLNLPGTYPALPLRGKMVSGFVAPDFDKACYPPSFAQTLRSLGYRMDLDGDLGLSWPEHVRDHIWPVFEARKTVFRHVIKHEYWDLCIAIITESDRLQHFYLQTLYDSNHPSHAWTKNFYVELDKFIGEVAESLAGKADLFIVSDHGFEVVRHQVIMAEFLCSLGLSEKSDYPSWSRPETAARTKVFCLDPGRFYINRKNSRFAHGFVEDAEVPEILDRLETALWALKDPKTGETLVNTVRRKTDAFWGQALDYAPDLIVATRPGYYFRSFWHPEHTKVREIGWEANHVWNDAIVYAPFPMRAGYQPVIWDVLPSVLTHMGVRLPDGLDGYNLARPNAAAVAR